MIINRFHAQPYKRQGGVVKKPMQKYAFFVIIFRCARLFVPFTHVCKKNRKKLHQWDSIKQIIIYLFSYTGSGTSFGTSANTIYSNKPVSSLVFLLNKNGTTRLHIFLDNYTTYEKKDGSDWICEIFPFQLQPIWNHPGLKVMLTDVYLKWEWRN